jgi:hypothetical protein
MPNMKYDLATSQLNHPSVEIRASESTDEFNPLAGQGRESVAAESTSPCWQFMVLKGSACESAQVRAYVRDRVTKTYEGWSDEFDRSFDDHTTWFCLSGGGTYLATCKLIRKTISDVTIKLPMELADRNPYCPAEANAIEGSGLTFIHREHLFTLMYCMGRWMKRHGIGRVASIVDARNDALLRIYHRALGFELHPHGVLSFTSFRHKDSGKPVDWQVITLEPTFFWTEANYVKLARRGAWLPRNGERVS